MREEADFNADWISPPGDTIATILKERGFDRSWFAEQLQWSRNDVDALLQGELAITHEAACRLSQILGSTERFWTKRELQYRDSLEQYRNHINSLDCNGWLASLPISEMKDQGWIRGNETAVECFRFFGVRSIEAWNTAYGRTLQSAAFRTARSFQSSIGAVAAWIRQGELLASRIPCGQWDPDGFMKELSNIRSLTRISEPSEFMPELTARCAAFGVAVVLLRAPRECKASGVAKFVTSNRPMILLSARHLSDDHLWFTFFHECGHLILHPDRGMFVDEDESSPAGNQEELDANSFSENMLIPAQYRQEFKELTANKIEVIRFARKLGISRGVIVGQLQHYGILRRNQLNDLKRWFSWGN